MSCVLPNSEFYKDFLFANSSSGRSPFETLSDISWYYSYFVLTKSSKVPSKCLSIYFEKLEND